MDYQELKDTLEKSGGQQAALMDELLEMTEKCEKFKQRCELLEDLCSNLYKDLNSFKAITFSVELCSDPYKEHLEVLGLLK